LLKGLIDMANTKIDTELPKFINCEDEVMGINSAFVCKECRRVFDYGGDGSNLCNDCLVILNGECCDDYDIRDLGDQ